jgi:hypothetical protein
VIAAKVPNLVSVIIPVFNRPAQLREALESVLVQDHPSLEVIIVDDGSTDHETLSTARALAAAHPNTVLVASIPNGGPGVAREHGRTLARGEFLQYLDSDDVLLPGKLSAQVKALRDAAQADVAYGITYLRDIHGRLLAQPHKATGNGTHTMFPSFLTSRWWETATPLYRAGVCDRAGPWTTLRLEEDWEYDCRIASLGGRLVWCPIPVSEHREHGGERLSRVSVADADGQRDRATARSLIYRHATRFGMTPEAAEMQTFSRSLFLLSRQCGAIGLADESRSLFALARQAAGPARGRGMDFNLYAAIAGAFGWSRAGMFADRIDRYLRAAKADVK